MGFRDIPPPPPPSLPMGLCKKVSECWSFLIHLSVREVWLSVRALQHESTPSQQAVLIAKLLFLYWNWPPARRTQVNRDSTAMPARGCRHQLMLVVGRDQETLSALVSSNLSRWRTWTNRSHLCNTSREGFWWSPIAGAVCKTGCQEQKCCLGKKTQHQS